LTHVLRLDPDDQAARRLKADTLRRLGFQTSNPIWRNNYLMAAREIDGTLDRTRLLDTLRALGNADVAATTPIPLLLRALATRLDPVKSDGVQLSVGFRCADTEASYGVAIRSAVAEVLASAPPDATLEIHTTEPALRGLLSGRTTWPRPTEEGFIMVHRGTAEEAARFWSLFDLPVGGLPALALR
jgi:alkyl sulfatase BDS1-like metallo-beta-lactamase superfamily hydrolase